MRQLKLMLPAIAIALLLLVFGTAVMADSPSDAVPASYAGLKNPFPWSDAAAQKAGQKLYQQSCLGCHGAKGDSVTQSDFSTKDYALALEERTDSIFWILSEGKIAAGMPPFKSSFSDEQRWQVLTYIWSLGNKAPAAGPPLVTPPAGTDNSTLVLTAPKEGQAGESLNFDAILRDDKGVPVEGANVEFFIKINFFASALVKIGEAVTDERGVAVLEYTPRQASDHQVVARYQGVEATAEVSISNADHPLYQVKAGIRLPNIGGDVVFGPKSALEPTVMGEAPKSVFRLPGGILSWLLLLIIGVLLIWATYFRVVYQVFCIPLVKEGGDTNTRLIPVVGMAIVVGLGVVLALMLLHGPYSHLHLLSISK